MKTIIFGGAGFLGSSIAKGLLGKNDEIVVFDLRSPKSDLMRKKGIQVIEGDLLKTDDAAISFEGVDFVVHMASVTSPSESMENPEKDRMNLTISQRIFEKAISAGVKRILYPSSGGTIYGMPEKLPVDETLTPNPKIPYAITKVQIEQKLTEMCEDSGTIPLIFRYGNPYGPNQYPARGTGVITAWLEKIRDGKPIDLYGGGEAARDYIFIQDATDACLLASDSARAKGVYNIGSGVPTTLQTIIETMKKVTGRKIEINALPLRSNDKVSKISLDIQKAEKDFGWKPKISLEKGIEATWRWVMDGEPFVI